MALEKWLSGHPVCLSFLSIPPWFWAALLALVFIQTVGRGVCVGATQRQCHFLISRAFPPSFRFPDMHPPGLFAGPPLSSSPLRPVTRLCLCLGPSVQGGAPALTTACAPLSVGCCSQHSLLSSLWWQVLMFQLCSSLLSSRAIPLSLSLCLYRLQPSFL